MKLVLQYIISEEFLKYLGTDMYLYICYNFNKNNKPF